MKVLGDLVVIVEALDEVDGFVSVGVVKSGELVAAGDVDLVVYDFQAERLEKAGANALPGEFAFELVNTFDDPNIAHPSADGGAFSIGIEIKSARAHPGSVRVEVGDRGSENIDSEGAGFVAPLDFSGDDNGRRFWNLVRVGVAQLGKAAANPAVGDIEVDGLGL
jgi:hypothetical protein